MLRFLVLSLALAALGLGQIHPALASDDTSKVNGSIRIDDGKSVGDLDTVNGSIHLGDHGQADEISTVNGSINVGDDAEIRSAGTVNGRISLGKRLWATMASIILATARCGLKASSWSSRAIALS